MTLYKVLAENGRPYHGGTGTWPLPNGEAGEWLEVTGEIVPCENGLHLCRRDDLINWLGPIIYTAEHDGEMVEDDDKIVVRRARLVERLDTWKDRTARLFAADCAERVLYLYESRYPNDDRARNAIEVARAVANGEAGISELDAAWAATWAAAKDAAWAAAWAATWAAASAVARNAARDAASAAARAAASAAARAAARAAAGDAAGDAAWDAAWAATRDAAWAVEREWQTTRLFDYLDGNAPNLPTHRTGDGS